ncbi:DUF998 domain-containing protein [Cryptosporangium aurantiacum]|uniref:Hypothetical membrane protein n=1 Tax=Cryptosporangium aurantiacum TaxID=134849 RepID=A0A1M7MTL7_9ACTN|nr:DUF998 domain-containing protein [Cryptosporangium aurantiacum]SHM94457.1 hypothetical membrane protein [Cryptosporangium aurantiacum]
MNRYRVLGGLALAVAGVAFFVGQVVVQSAWTTPFSWADNNISDLGMVSCGTWGDPARYVCSPWHPLMNAVFVVNGVLIAIGVVLGLRGRAARGLLLAAAVGCVLVGYAPADVDENLHVLGAVLVFLLGNAGMIAARSVTRGPRWLPVLFGVVGLVATGLHLSKQGLGLGVAGMERLALFPLFVWFVIEGVLIVRDARRRIPSDRADAAGVA